MWNMNCGCNPPEIDNGSVAKINEQRSYNIILPNTFDKTKNLKCEVIQDFLDVIDNLECGIQPDLQEILEELSLLDSTLEENISITKKKYKNNQDNILLGYWNDDFYWNDNYYWNGGQYDNDNKKSEDYDPLKCWSDDFYWSDEYYWNDKYNKKSLDDTLKEYWEDNLNCNNKCY